MHAKHRREIAKYAVDAILSRPGSTNPKKNKKNYFNIFFFRVFKFTWKMWNILKRMKNIFSDFYFSFNSADSASFM